MSFLTAPKDVLTLFKTDNAKQLAQRLRLTAPVAERDPGSAQWLIFAVALNATACVQAMLSAGVDLDARDNEGRSALMMSVQTDNADMFHLLLAAGSDPNAMDAGGSGIWHILAAREPHPLLLERIAKLPLTVDQPNAHGLTPLHLAALNDNCTVLEALLRLGASPAAQDPEGNTPLFIAGREGHQAAFNHLVKAGSSIHHTNDRGRSLPDVIDEQLEWVAPSSVAVVNKTP